MKIVSNPRPGREYIVRVREPGYKRSSMVAPQGRITRKRIHASRFKITSQDVCDRFTDWFRSMCEDNPEVEFTLEETGQL